MNGYRAEPLTIARSDHDESLPGAFAVSVRRRSARVVRRGSRVDTLDRPRPLRCVSSGYLADGCSCRSSIPADVVAAAWATERERCETYGDRFFHFAWGGGVWLAYGLRDGRVRGVYCPSHRWERNERSSLYEPRAGSAPAQELALSA